MANNAYRYDNTSFFPEPLIGVCKWNMTDKQVLDVLEKAGLVWDNNGKWQARYPTKKALDEKFVRKGKNNITSLLVHNPEFNTDQIMRRIGTTAASARSLYEWDMDKIGSLVCLKN